MRSICNGSAKGRIGRNSNGYLHGKTQSKRATQTEPKYGSKCTMPLPTRQQSWPSSPDQGRPLLADNLSAAWAQSAQGVLFDGALLVDDLDGATCPADNVRPAGAATRINLAIIVVQDGDVANRPGLNPESAGRKCGREPGPIPGLRLLLSSRGAASMAVHRCGLSESGTSSGLARGRK
jgi:hypothetical protein